MPSIQEFVLFKDCMWMGNIPELDFDNQLSLLMMYTTMILTDDAKVIEEGIKVMMCSQANINLKITTNLID